MSWTGESGFGTKGLAHSEWALDLSYLITMARSRGGIWTHSLQTTGHLTGTLMNTCWVS